MPKRILCAFLASLLLLGALTACGDSSGSTDTDNADTILSDAQATETESRESLDIPDTRYDGQELVFLTRGDEGEWTTSEIYSAGMTSDSDNINNAVYERNLFILENYGVTVKEIAENKNTHISRVTNEIAGKTGDFQVVVSNTANSASLSAQGALWDLQANELGYMDLSKSWWDQNMVQSLSIHDRLYFATGDILTADNDATYVMLFNKQIAADNRLPDLYALVENMEWTMSAFLEYAARGAKEVDGIAGLSYDNDVAGYAYTSSSPNSFLISAGITLCTKDENDYPVYSLNVDRAQSVSELGKRIFDKTSSVCMDDAAKDGISLAEVGQVCFGEDHALFLGEVMQSVTRMRGYDVDFGILPFPMFDEAQGRYSSMMHQTASMISIPKSVSGDTLTMTASMLEAMAYHSVDTLTKQYYEINLKTKGAKDEKSGPMIDKILASRACDLSYYYNWGGNAFGQIANTLLPTSKDAVASLDRKFERLVNNDITALVKGLDASPAP